MQIEPCLIKNHHLKESMMGLAQKFLIFFCILGHIGGQVMGNAKLKVEC